MQILNLSGIENVLTTTRDRGYNALPLVRAEAWPRRTVGATVTFLTKSEARNFHTKTPVGRTHETKFIAAAHQLDSQIYRVEQKLLAEKYVRVKRSQKVDLSRLCRETSSLYEAFVGSVSGGHVKSIAPAVSL